MEGTSVYEGKDGQRSGVSVQPNTEKRHTVIFWPSSTTLWLCCQQDDLMGDACSLESCLPALCWSSPCTSVVHPLAILYEICWLFMPGPGFLSFLVLHFFFPSYASITLAL